MLQETIDWLKSLRSSCLSSPGRILEVGSQVVNGSAREAFIGENYLGTDMDVGPGVDLAIPSTGLIQKFGLESFDTIICCDTLEHDRTFWRTVEDMHLLLKRGGHLVITVPGIGYGYHGFPRDYYRFTEDVFRDVFFAGFEIIELKTLEGYGAVSGSSIFQGVAKK